MQAFTQGRLEKTRADAVIAHMLKCTVCHQQQSQMAVLAMIAKMQEMGEKNKRSACSDPFWESPYPLAPVTSPPSAKKIRRWEAEHKVRLPATLARSLQTQNGGRVRGTEIVICPLEEFQLLSESKWDEVFRFNQVVSERDKLLYIGFEEQGPARIILNYAKGSEPAVLYLWHDLGDELREQASSFDALVEKT